jgi:hypothetical protein
MSIRYPAIFLAFLFSACIKQGGSSTSYKIEPSLNSYVESFFAEAAKRGYTFERKNLIVDFNTGSDGALCGSCNTISNDPGIQKIVSVFNANPCWFNDQELESLIFHELGHCILGRSHVMDTLPNGNAKSIMTPHDISLYAPCTYQIGNQPCDNSYKRSYYLDELFNSSTPAPDWSH